MTLGGGDQTAVWWQKKFKYWLENVEKNSIKSSNRSDNAIWEKMIERWNDSNDNNKTLEGLFTNKTIFSYDEKQRVQAYANLFGIPGNITTWEELKNKDFSVRQ